MPSRHGYICCFCVLYFLSRGRFLNDKQEMTILIANSTIRFIRYPPKKELEAIKIAGTPKLRWDNGIELAEFHFIPDDVDHSIRAWTLLPDKKLTVCSLDVKCDALTDSPYTNTFHIATKQQQAIMFVDSVISMHAKKAWEDRAEREEQDAAAIVWEAGDICKAVWSADGKLYTAKILQVVDAHTIKVEYMDFGEVADLPLAQVFEFLSDAALSPPEPILRESYASTTMQSTKKGGNGDYPGDGIQLSNLKVGDVVLASWSDGSQYDACIQAINDDGTLTVEYDQYGEVATLDLHEVFPADEAALRRVAARKNKAKGGASLDPPLPKDPPPAHRASVVPPPPSGPPPASAKKSVSKKKKDDKSKVAGETKDISYSYSGNSQYSVDTLSSTEAPGQRESSFEDAFRVVAPPVAAGALANVAEEAFARQHSDDDLRSSMSKQYQPMPPSSPPSLVPPAQAELSGNHRTMVYGGNKSVDFATMDASFLPGRDVANSFGDGNQPSKILTPNFLKAMHTDDWKAGDECKVSALSVFFCFYSFFSFLCCSFF